MVRKYASKLLISLSFLLATTTQAEAVLTCNWPASQDTFTERATGYLVTASDWNYVQCILQKIEQQLGNNLENVFALSANNTATGDNIFTGLTTFTNTVDVADKQDTVGNKIKLRANNGTFSSTCGNIGEADYLTIADTSNTQGVNNWTFCADSGDYFHIPETGSSYPGDNYILVGDTSTGVEALWRELPTDCTTGIIFNGTTFSCGYLSGAGTGNVLGPTLDPELGETVGIGSIPVWETTDGTKLKGTQVYITTDNGLILMDNDTLSSTGGNKIQLYDNDSYNHNCSSVGISGLLTLMDLEQETDLWGFCDGTADFFMIPNTGSSTIIDNAILVGGTTAGTGTWVEMEICNSTTQKLHFDGISFSCVADMGGAGSVSGPGSTSVDTIPVWNSTDGTVLKATSISVNSNNQITMPDNSNVTGGNQFKLLENNGSAAVTCADVTLAADSLVLLDTTNSSSDTWDFCMGGSPYFRIPLTGSSYAGNNKFLVGTGNNTANWSNAVSCNAESESLTFDGTNMDCQPDTRSIIFTLNHFDYDYSGTARYYPMNTTITDTADPLITTSTNAGTPVMDSMICTDMKINTNGVNAGDTLTIKLLRDGTTQILSCAVTNSTPDTSCTNSTVTVADTNTLTFSIQCTAGTCTATNYRIYVAAKCRFTT